MKNYFTAMLMFAFIAGAWAQDSPRAFLKAQYDEISRDYSLEDHPDSLCTHIRQYVLQIAHGKSYYYDPQTYYVDSLQHDPNGASVLKAVWDNAYAEMVRTQGQARPDQIVEAQGLAKKSLRKMRKDFDSGKIHVLAPNMGSYVYDVEISDLVWELGDSTKTILGYECTNAVADYHGRKWEAWFAPEIAVQDGPWQLCGLPGLIMEASTLDGYFSFVITGLQKCDETLKPTFETGNEFKTSRKSYWKQVDYTRKNRGAQVAAMTGGNVKINNTKQSRTVGNIETDYLE